MWFLLLFEALSQGGIKVTSLTVDLAPASAHAYLKSTFGKTIPVLVFTETDASV